MDRTGPTGVYGSGFATIPRSTIFACLLALPIGILCSFSFRGLHNGLLSCMEIGVAWTGQDQQVFTAVALLRYPVRQYLLACLHCL